jgi:tRNA (cytidine/uridine-2'-O-)-methyltransferase
MVRRRRCRHDSKPFPKLAAGGTVPKDAPDVNGIDAGARDPRGGNKTGFFGRWRPNKQSRIVLLAPLPKERKPTIRQPTCNALNPSRPLFYSDIRKDTTRMELALFQPDIPQNTGTILRLCACLDVRAHVIEPAGFPVSDRAFRRAGMDYLDQVTWMRHDSWTRFEQWRRSEGFRLLLFTTKAAVSYLDFRYAASDILLFGRETVGVTDEVVAAADARLKIPMKPALRSLNVAIAAAMVVGEALRQTKQEMD